MVVDWSSFLLSLVSPMTGLAGVWLGGRLVSNREASKEKDRAERDTTYLAILVTAHLDRFISGCLQVALDDGSIEGRFAGANGQYRAFTVVAPTFNPLELTVEWKVLPPDLLYSILNLPYRAELLDAHISSVWATDDAPERTDTFWARQKGYATLGLEGTDLVNRLRHHAGLPEERLLAGGQDRESMLRGQRDAVAQAEADFEARL